MATIAAAAHGPLAATATPAAAGGPRHGEEASALPALRPPRATHDRPPHGPRQQRLRRGSEGRGVAGLTDFGRVSYLVRWPPLAPAEFPVLPACLPASLSPALRYRISSPRPYFQ